METLSSIVGSIAGKMAESIPKILDPHAGYLFKYESKVQDLRDQVEKLKDARERVQGSVNQEKRNGKVILKDVDRWLIEAKEKISDEFDKQLKADEEKAKTKCFVGLCPNFKSRYQLGKKAEKEANSIANLLKDAHASQFVPPGVSCAPAPPGVTPTKDFVAFDSRKAALTEVMELLQEDGINIIGVHGMGGLGKTTLVKEVANQAKELFKGGAFATITQKLNIENIQDNLAVGLGLEFKLSTNPGRASQLRQSIKNMKKVLIILDDIWKYFKLELIGIPFDHQGCKILMTSRDLQVLSEMGSQKNIPIDILNENEAWNLFQKMAGTVTESHEIGPTAREVAERCGGLPIALTVIGRALKDKTKPQWKTALQDMKRPPSTNSEWQFKEVYSNMELSYTYLPSDLIKKIFLLCSIMGHNASIEDLLKYGMGLDLFLDDNTIEEARNRAITLVVDLKARSLLNGSNEDVFDMHDVVRHVARKIARDQHWLALGRGGDEVRGWSDPKAMEKWKLISLQYCEVSELFKHDLQCSNLTFFSLVSEDSLTFPDQFFNRMKKLEVLDFSKLCLSPLPSSIGCLTNIRSLCLSECLLEDVAMVGDLKSLEILNLQRSKITMLPEKIGQLTKLKSLDLSCCDNLNVIIPGVLSRLSNLEELYLLHGFSQWEREGHEEPSCNARLAELKDLSKLTSLEVEICDEYAVAQFLFSEKLERHKVLIRQGTRGQNYFIRKSSEFLPERVRALVFCETTSVTTYEGVKKSLKKIDFLHLNDVRGVKDVVYDLNTEGFPDLKHLQISHVSEIQYIINSDQRPSSEVFPILESLNLHDLCNLEKICNNGEAAFSQLRRISISYCHKLENLFPYSIAKRLTQLEKIDIFKCDNMIELFAVAADEGQIEGISERDDEEKMTLVFPKLESLELWGLPNFTTLCSCSRYNISIQFSSLIKLKIGRFLLPRMIREFVSCKMQVTGNISMEDHPSQPLFDEKIITFPKLQELEVGKWGGMASLIATSSSEAFQNLTKLVVHLCDNLKNVFLLSFLKSQCFEQLRELEIKSCDNLEAVIVVVEVTSGRDRLVFPKLESLTLYKLPNLIAFCCCSGYNSISIEFPSLKQLTISQCSVLQTFESTSANGAIEGTGNNSVEDHCIQPLFNEKITFPKLEELKLEYLPKLAAFCSSSESNSISVEFPSLKELTIVKCSVLQQFVSISASGAIERISNNSSTDHCIQPLFNEKTTFPKLEKLALHVDSSMKEMWHEQMYFSKVKQLELGGRIAELSCSQLSQALSPFPALEGLGISDSGSEEILQNGNASSNLGDDKVLSQIRSLTLSRLPKMMHLWKEKDSFQNLTTLKVERCGNISSLVPLPNLVTLQVKYCNGIIKLMTASTAKSLVKLTEMTISWCSKIKEIVECGDEEEQVKDEITFPSLTHLKLEGLYDLECFSSSTNHAFRFPSLELLDFGYFNLFPKMKVFTHGQLDTPKLQKFGDKQILESSLNATIQRLINHRKCRSWSRNRIILDDEDDEDLR